MPFCPPTEIFPWEALLKIFVLVSFHISTRYYFDIFIVFLDLFLYLLKRNWREWICLDSKKVVCARNRAISSVRTRRLKRVSLDNSKLHVVISSPHFHSFSLKCWNWLCTRVGGWEGAYFNKVSAK